MQVIVGWLVAAVFVTAWISTPGQAVDLAAKVMGIAGTTAGALLGGTDDLISGFNGARGAADKNPAPAPRHHKSGGAASHHLAS